MRWKPSAMRCSTGEYRFHDLHPVARHQLSAGHGNIYHALTDIYEPNYAPNMADVLPSTTPLATLFANGILPESALFSSTPPVTGTPLDAALAVPSNPIFAAGFRHLEFGDQQLPPGVRAGCGGQSRWGGATQTAGVPVAANPQNTCAWHSRPMICAIGRLCAPC